MARRSVSYLAIVAVFALPLAAGGCATPADQTASLQWQFNGTQFAQEGTSAQSAYFGNAYAAESSDADRSASDSWAPDGSASDGAAVREDGSAASGWSERTYVYRGGRDPRTGLALNRM